MVSSRPQRLSDLETNRTGPVPGRWLGRAGRARADGVRAAEDRVLAPMFPPK